MDYAAAVNEEIKDLFAAGAAWSRSTNPICRPPGKGAAIGVHVLNRALSGVTGTTAVHICFEYAAIIHQRPLTRSCPNSKAQMCSKSRSNCIIPPRLQCARGAVLKDHHARGVGSFGHVSRKAGDRGRSNSPRAAAYRCKRDRRRAYFVCFTARPVSASEER
jgi:hypothetical protein